MQDNLVWEISVKVDDSLSAFSKNMDGRNVLDIYLSLTAILKTEFIFV